jgi:hypothetical protein
MGVVRSAPPTEFVQHLKINSNIISTCMSSVAGCMLTENTIYTQDKSGNVLLTLSSGLFRGTLSAVPVLKRINGRTSYTMQDCVCWVY